MRKLLIVEDDLIVSNIYRSKLVHEGYKVEVASDGESGWSVIQDFRPDLVLLDLMLPKVSGVDLLRKMRSTPDFKALPVIVFSNTYLTSLMQEAWKAGATKCLAKANCTPRQLVEVVEGYFRTGADPAPSPAPDSVAAGPATLKSETPPTEASSDYEFQENLRKNLLASLPAKLQALRPILQTAARAGSSPANLAGLERLHQEIRKLASAAGVSGLSSLARMASATEALVKELQERPKNLNASTLRTVAWAIDFIRVIAEKAPEENEAPSFGNVLVVDDEPISRQAVGRALTKAGLNAVTVDSAKIALYLLEENRFGLVFLDIDMPEMKGFELCAKLRSIPRHAKTPVVFVTGLNDFESRANSSMSGGTDFIGKPFLPIELGVKALGYVTRGWLEAQKKHSV